ncbi:dephospho-CoA kinase [Propionibacterium cyclohexanicum]|uniref:Dephospho-CoA kinase n=1 Tax=Propionibacterium cyclohexanicum TaxID=64702 RepID=A0A1H9PKC1_9ACTN|nr:dephospho-CoA kinase [Propionibacterium cyclohexanicum]SER48662.1 dephospho-CoA kinase [Propionibacterium cyclohexanicum]
MPALRVGLTGGIACGKSLVAGMLRAHGAVVIDNDVLARQVVEPGTPGLAALVRRFGRAVLAADGSLDRHRLAAIVFEDASALEELNAIVHPLVRRAAAEAEARMPEDAVVVHDIPLLIESGQAGDFDLLVVVDVPEELQLRRLVEREGLDEAGARARIESQVGRPIRLAAADVVIDNAGTRQHTRDQVDALWHSLVRRSSRT